jgi:phage shock protein B
MHDVAIVAIALGSILVILAIIPVTILLIIRLFKGGISRSDRKKQAEEAKMIQEIYQGLSRMEERVDALETILLDREKEDRSQ